MDAEVILQGIRSTLPNWETFIHSACPPDPSRPLTRCNE